MLDEVDLSNIYPDNTIDTEAATWYYESLEDE